MRILYWLVLNSAFLACVIAGAIFGIQGAINVVYFMAGLSFVVGLFALIPDIGETVRESGYTFNKWIELLYDVAITLILVYTGFWWSAIGYFIGNLIVIGAKEND